MPATKPKKKPISQREVNDLLHDTLLHEVLDQLGAPKEHNGGVLSAYGRLRRVAPSLLAATSAARELEREIIKLRKAGDAMAEYLAPCPIPTAEPTERDFLLANWEEAKSSPN